MKLRNKKTGKLFIPEEWESVEEYPMIAPEDIRHIVKAWYEANDFADKLMYIEQCCGTWCAFKANARSTDYLSCEIYFTFTLGLENGKEYTIAELCGEEEE